MCAGQDDLSLQAKLDRMYAELPYPLSDREENALGRYNRRRSKGHPVRRRRVRMAALQARYNAWLAEHDRWWAAHDDTLTYTNLFGEHGPGCAKRTVEASPDMFVDLDGSGHVIGVETIGENIDWRNALAALAMAGRLVVPRQHRNPWIPADPDGLPPETYPAWRRQEIARREEDLA